MRKTFKLFVCLMACLTVFMTAVVPVHAAEGQIFFNDPKVEVGNQVTVTMTLSTNDGSAVLGALDAALTYDTSLLEYVSGTGPSGFSCNGGDGGIKVSWYDANGSAKVPMNFVFKTLAEGTGSVKIASAEISSVDGETLNPSHLGNSAVTIGTPVVASSEAGVTSLSVGPGNLSPAFNPDVHEYSITVPFETTKLVITAKLKDANAKYSINGNDLKVGTNTVTVVSTAQDKKTKVTYTIKATRQDEVKIMVPVKIDGTTRYVNGIMNETALPEGYEIRETSIGGETVEMGAGNLQLVWVSDKDGSNGALYSWDGASGYTKYVEVPAAGVYVVRTLANNVEVPEGYEESTTTVNGDTVTCFKKDDSGFVLLYVINPEGKSDFYSYDTAEKTLQRYVEPVVTEPEIDEPAEPQPEEPGQNLEIITPEELAKLKSDLADAKNSYLKYKYIAIGLLAICVLELILIIVLIIVLRKNTADDDEEEIDEEAAALEAEEQARAERYAKYNSTEQGEAASEEKSTLVNVRAFEAAEPVWSGAAKEETTVWTGAQTEPEGAEVFSGIAAVAAAAAETEAAEEENAEDAVKAEFEALLKSQAEAEARAKAEAEAMAKAQAEAEERARAQAEAEAMARAQAEAEERARAEAEAMAKAQAEAEERARAQAEAMAKAQAELEAAERAREEAAAEFEALMKAQAEAEERAKAEAEAMARAQAEAEERARAAAEAMARTRAEAEIRAKSEAIERAQAEARAKAEADAMARAEAEAKAVMQAEAAAKAAAKTAEAAPVKESAEVTDAEAKARAEWEALAAAYIAGFDSDEEDNSKDKGEAEKESFRYQETEIKQAERRAARQAKLEKKAKKTQPAKTEKENETEEKPSWFKRFFMDEVDEDDEE